MRTLSIAEISSVTGGLSSEAMLLTGAYLSAAAFVAELGFCSYAGYYLASTSGIASGMIGVSVGISTFALAYYSEEIVNHIHKHYL